MPNMYNFYFSRARPGGIVLSDKNGSTLSGMGVDSRIRCHLHMHLHRLLLLGSKILLVCRRVQHLLLILLSVRRSRVAGHGGRLAAR